MIKTKSIVAALALLGASAGATLAHAADVSQSSAVELTGNTAHFGRDLTSVSAGDIFSDRWNFSTAGAVNFVGGVIAVSPGLFDNIAITDLRLFNSAGLSIGGVQHGNGVADVWTIKALGPLVADSYYLQVTGSVLSGANTSYGGMLTLAPIPEPATYGMLLGGLGVLGFLARRRKNQA